MRRVQSAPARQDDLAPCPPDRHSPTLRPASIDFATSTRVALAKLWSAARERRSSAGDIESGADAPLSRRASRQRLFPSFLKSPLASIADGGREKYRWEERCVCCSPSPSSLV